METKDLLELHSLNKVTLKQLFTFLLVVGAIFAYFLVALLEEVLPHFSNDPIVVVIFSIYMLSFPSLVLFLGFYGIRKEIKKLILLYDKIFIINPYNRIHKQVPKNELTLIRIKKELPTILEIRTNDFTRKILLRDFEKDQSKIEELRDKIIDYCTKHYPREIYTKSKELTDKKKTEDRSGTRIY